MITVSDVEWMLSDEFDVFQRNGILVISFGDLNGFAVTRDFLGTPVVTLQFMPASSLQPSPSLFRWVAVTAGKFVLGSLSADLNDDGLVDVWLQHSLFDSSLEGDDLRLVVRVLATTANDLRQDLNSLFG
jgi:hypothetical protein